MAATRAATTMRWGMRQDRQNRLVKMAALVAAIFAVKKRGNNAKEKDVQHNGDRATGLPARLAAPILPAIPPGRKKGVNMTAFVSLFRGINVGGHHQIKMSELKALHESLGLKDVLPFIQSGNVIFTSDSADVASVPQLQKDIEDGFESKFGFHAQVLIRSSAELNDIIDKNPLPEQESRESKWMAVMFLAACPNDTAKEALLTTYIGPEELFFTGKELYLYYPKGMGRSKLTNGLIEKKLKTFGTARNWNTILKLQTLLGTITGPR